MENKKDFPCSKCGKVYQSFSGRYKHEKKCEAAPQDQPIATYNNPSHVTPSAIPPPVVETPAKTDVKQMNLGGLDMRRWNPQVIIDRYQNKSEPFIGLWYGMKESGKTTSIISILKKIRPQLDKIYIFTIAKNNKERYQNELGNIKDSDCFGGFDDPDTTLFIEKLIKFQELTGGRKRVLLLLDDIIDGKNALHQSKILGSLFANHRRYNISIVLATQIPTGIAPITRQNTNFCFIHYTKNDSVKDMIYKDYLSCLEKKEFQAMFEAVTRDHNILVVEPLLHDDFVSVYNAMWD